MGGGRCLRLDAERGDLSGRRHQGQGHRFGTEAVELVHEFLRAGTRENRLDDLLDRNPLIAWRTIPVILDNVSQIVAPA